MTDLRDGYWGDCFLRALGERGGAWRGRHSRGAWLTIADALLRSSIRGQPRREAEGLRPLRQATHHVFCSYAQHSFTELDDAKGATRPLSTADDGRMNFQVPS